jgi:colanic acid biosynthesis glycosyl transferase WcaI
LRILLLNQCFYPDVVSTAQHLTDLARGLAERGHEVTVIASDRGYDDPARRFPRREIWNNIEVIRIPSLSLGKETKIKRALTFASFLVVCFFRLLTLRSFDRVVALTSPPLISFLAALLISLKGGRFCFWVMDLNPDEAIAAGWLREGSLAARSLQRLLGYSLKRADRVVVLDRFMKDRVLAKGVEPVRVTILPPWSHDESISYSAVGRDEFRCKHALTRKFVVMYSGNHSPCHPLDTLLDAALTLSTDQNIAFCFVGGGTEQEKVREFSREHKLHNILCLPYQPLELLSSSLSAADLHVVVMGDHFTGIVHPCKIYNILRIGGPVLYIGPPQSHVTDIADQFKTDHIFVARHGDSNLIVEKITALATRKVSASPFPLSAFSKLQLLPQMISLVELALSSEGENVNALAGTYSPDPDPKSQEVVSL